MHRKRISVATLVLLGAALIGVTILAIPHPVKPVPGLSADDVREIRKVASDQTYLDPYGSLFEAPHAIKVNLHYTVGEITRNEDGTVCVQILWDKRPYMTHELRKTQGRWEYFGTMSGPYPKNGADGSQPSGSGTNGT